MPVNRFFIQCTCITFLCTLLGYLVNNLMHPGFTFPVLHNQAIEKHTETNQHSPFFPAGLSMTFPSYWKSNFLFRKRQNNPPVVKILSPKNNTSVEPNTLIRYAISVSDEEDGKSEFGEISSSEVFLEIIYVPDSSKATEYIVANTNNEADPPGLSAIKTSDCFNCHAIKNKLQGPPFAEVARRYTGNPSTVETLAMRIMKGSSGAWGNAAMPPHPDITPEQARQIVQWILTQAADPAWDLYVGLEGSFRTNAKSDNNGVYILSASYIDHGVKDRPQLRTRGQHTIVLKTK